LTRAAWVVGMIGWLVGCGGASSSAPPAEPLPPVAAVADAGPARPLAPADAAPVDRCGGYELGVRPVLARLARAAEVFLDNLGRAHMATEVVDAATGFAAAIDAEKPALAALVSTDAALDAAHARLGATLAELAEALRSLAAAYQDASRAAAREASTRRVNAAIAAWGQAVAEVQKACPGIE
jgi:hypothetical protein